MNTELKLVDFFKPEGYNDRIILYFGSKDLEVYKGKDWEVTPYEDIAGQVEQKVECKVQYLLSNHVAFRSLKT